MKSSKFGKVLVISSVCAFAFWGIPAESVWLDTAKETTKKLEEAGQQAIKLKDIGQELKDGSTTVHGDVAQDTGRWTPTTVRGAEVKQKMRLAQLKSPAERKKEAELAEQAAKKKLEELKKQIELRKQAKRSKKQAEKARAHKQKLKEEARLEEERKLRLKEQAGLEVERKARQEQQDRQEKKRLAKFIKQIGDHSCNEYDVSNKKRVLACLRALENDRVKNKDSALPSVLGVLAEKGKIRPYFKEPKCNDMKENLRKNLQALGFWKDAIDKRVPGCKIFAVLYKEKHGDDVYWSKCVEKPRSDPQYIFDCLNFGTTIYPHSSLNIYPGQYRRNLEAAGHIVGVEVEHRYNRNIWKPVYELGQKWKKAKLAAKGDVKREFLYKYYYAETPEREKSKYSGRERRLIKNDKLVVPAKYTAPTSEEIRLAVMSSLVDRKDEMTHRRVGEVLRRSRSVDSRNPVVTDGHTILLPFPGLMGIEVKFREPKNIRCSKRKSHVGYMCQYSLGSEGSSMGRFGEISGRASWAASYLTKFARPVNNWFVLTEKGWRQPHTDGQIAELKVRYKQAELLIQNRRERRYSGGMLLEHAVQAAKDEMYIRSAMFGRDMIGLW